MKRVLNSAQIWSQARVLASSNLKARYRNTWAGFLWVVLNPLILFLAQMTICRLILRVDVQDYPLFLLTGLLPWFFLSQTAEMSTSLFVTHAQLLRSLPVHPLTYVLAQALDCFVNFVAAFLIIFLCSLSLTGANPKYLLLFPLACAPLLLGGFAIAWILAILQVFLRDTRFIVSFTLNVTYFLTPVFYPSEMLPARLQWLSKVNPFYFLIQPFRTSLYRFDPMDFAVSLGVASGAAMALLAVAALFWRAQQNRLALHA